MGGDPDRAPYYHGNVIDILESMDAILSDPFHIKIVDNSIQCVGVLLIAYFFGIGIWLSMKGNHRRGEEHGSAKWAMLDR